MPSTLEALQVTADGSLTKRGESLITQVLGQRAVKPFFVPEGWWRKPVIAPVYADIFYASTDGRSTDTSRVRRRTSRARLPRRQRMEEQRRLDDLEAGDEAIRASSSPPSSYPVWTVTVDESPQADPVQLGSFGLPGDPSGKHPKWCDETMEDKIIWNI